MARYRGTTKQRGLGGNHQADKKRLLARLRDGDPCWRCGQAMYKWQALDRDHVIDRALGGTMGPAVLAHASCNRSAGAKLGNQLQPRLTMAGGRDTICTTCSKVYSRAPRLCEICGAHYHPNHGGQRSCSRKCGAEVVRRNRMAEGWLPRAQRPKPVRKPGPVTSGERKPKNGWPATAIAYYTCRYCGTSGVTRANAKPGCGQREVCEARRCQLARLQANNMIARNGVTREDADAFMARIVRGITRQARQ